MTEVTEQISEHFLVGGPTTRTATFSICIERGKCVGRKKGVDHVFEQHQYRKKKKTIIKGDGFLFQGRP